MTSPDPISDPLLDAIVAPHRRRWGRWVVLLLFLAAVAGGWAWWSRRGKEAESGPRYTTEALARGDLSLTVIATGNLEPTNQVTIGSELSGTTQQVYVDTNDQVTHGQPLARLDTSKLDQQIESARARLASTQAGVLQAEATLHEHEATLARQKQLQELSGGKIPSKAEMETAVAAVDRARADLESARAAVGEAQAQIRIQESDLGKSVIKSPIDGIVLTRSLEPGQTVAASFTAPELFVIAEKLEQMKLKVAVAEADIARVAKGQSATFTVDAWPGRIYTATVTKVAFGSAIVDNVVTYETELEVSNNDLSLRPGMTATVEIAVAQEKKVFLVSTAALRFSPEAPQPNGPAAPAAGAPSGGSRFVQSLVPQRPRRRSAGGRGGPRKGGASPRERSQIWILREGKPVALPVQVGLSDGRRTVVSGEGLEEGLPVITRANTVTP